MSHQVAIREEELKNRVAALYFGKYDCTRIFCTTNPLTAEVTFGTSRAFGPVVVTNKTLEVDLGHLLATNGEKAAMYFWDDANSNCVRDVEETFARQALPIRGHDERAHEQAVVRGV